MLLAVCCAVKYNPSKILALAPFFTFFNCCGCFNVALPLICSPARAFLFGTHLLTDERR